LTWQICNSLRRHTEKGSAVIVRTIDKGTIIALEREKKVGEDRIAAIPTGVSTAKKFAKELLPIIMGLESIKY
jgi:hypothetical protein